MTPIIIISFYKFTFVSEEAIEKRKKILDEADIEEGKRDLITREIGKFREIMKVSVSSFSKQCYTLVLIVNNITNVRLTIS